MGREIESRQYESSTCYISVQRTYDALGRAYQVSNPFRPCQSEPLLYTTTLYDSLSRTKTVTTPDSSATTYAYQNNQTTVTDAAGNDRKTISDGLGRLTQVSENPSVLNLLTTYTYNGADSLLSVNQSGQSACQIGSVWYSRCFAYDYLQRLTSATNPENGTVNYTSYDRNGNLLTKTDARAITTTMTYDELNRVKTKSYSNGDPTVFYSYDDSSVSNSLGRLTKVDNGNQWQILSYDPLGRPTSSSETVGTTYVFPQYAYNHADSLTSVTYPSGRVINSTYDQAGRINAVSGVLNSGTTNYAPSITYASQGGISVMTLSNTRMTEQWCYNDRLQPIGIRLGSAANAANVCSDPGGDPLNLAYTYGTTTNNGNVLSQTITRQGQSWVQNYTVYDRLNRLTAASEGSAWSQAYLYDNFGNRAVDPASYMPYPGLTPTALSQYDTHNQWTGGGAAYDPTGNGNQTALTSRTFTYDAENRLTASTQPGMGAISYSYDGDGRRVTKNVGGAMTTYVYDAEGQLAAAYGLPTDSGTSFMTADHLGSTRVVTDGSGAVKKCYDYLPFGEEIAAGIGGRPGCFPNVVYPSNPDTLAEKFTGKERDAETGLDYFGARYFSAAQGRFTSPDPSPSGIAIQDPQSWNLYSYVRNRPTRFVDGNGLWPTELHKTIIDIALSGYMSAGELARLSARQDVMDHGPGSQSPEFSYQHFMRSPRQTAAGAADEAWAFVTTRGLQATTMLGPGGELTPEALDDLGDAMHTVQDFTSPAHTNSSGEPYIWRGPLGENVRYVGHYFGEEGPQVNWARFGEAIRLTMALVVQYAPDAARERGLTAANLDAEAAKRISAYIANFFSTMPGSMFGPSRAVQEDAARQCALGNPAACGQ